MSILSQPMAHYTAIMANAWQITSKIVPNVRNNLLSLVTDDMGGLIRNWLMVIAA